MEQVVTDSEREFHLTQAGERASEPARARGGERAGAAAEMEE